MITKYFRCKLLSDVVMNASLATEGNMISLDYIPGSNFLGIVANNYGNFSNKETYEIFHSGKVSFGDAYIAKDNAVTYPIPLSLFTDKLNNNILKDDVWVHHAITNKKIVNRKNEPIQLKQVRKGYFNKNNDYFKTVKKEFYLKSAYNPEQRRSKESAMFGFDAIKKGQEFIFSVLFENVNHVSKVATALIGLHHLGKSKTAEYGLVEISEINEQVDTFKNKPVQNNQLIIYAHSNLCFVNEYGQFTLQPEAKNFGVNGKVLWEKSQIRTYSYSPWNSHRNTTSTQRDVILKGSVIVIELDKDVEVDSLPAQVGEFNAEGLGRVIYNPEFLEFGENGIWNIKLSEYKKDDNKQDKVPINSDLGKFLQDKAEDKNLELEIGNKILEVFKEDEKNGKVLLSDKITKSQWGNIRTLATRAKDINELILKLFDEDKGYLTHGVADEKIWGKQNGKRRKALEKIIDDNKKLGTKFAAKFAAEIAKKN